MDNWETPKHIQELFKQNGGSVSKTKPFILYESSVIIEYKGWDLSSKTNTEKNVFTNYNWGNTGDEKDSK
jgi:hypothetical protein